MTTRPFFAARPRLATRPLLKTFAAGPDPEAAALHPGRQADRDLVGFGIAMAILASALVGTTFALYRPAVADLLPFALAAFALGGALAGAGWSGGIVRGR